jgi:hypothetical protein
MAGRRPKTKVRHSGVNGVVGSTTLRDQSVDLIEDLIGINLKNLGDASPEDFAKIGDLHRANQRLMKMLPTLEKYLFELLAGRLAYEGFLARVQKAGYDTQKRIDRGVLDLFLVQSGYNAHLTTMQQRQSAGLAKITASTRAENELIAFDLQTYLQQLALTHAKRKKRRQEDLQFNNAVGEQMEDYNLMQRMWEQGNLHALKNGSDAPNPYYARVGYQPSGTTSPVQYRSPFERSSNAAGDWVRRQAGRGATAAGRYATRQAGRGARAAGRAAKKGASGMGKRIMRFLGFKGGEA